MKNRNKLIFIGVVCIFWMWMAEIPVFSGVMGIDEPGTTNWSNIWFGAIENVLILDNDTMPSGLSIDKQHDITRVHFGYSSPYFRKVDQQSGDIAEPV